MMAVDTNANEYATVAGIVDSLGITVTDDVIKRLSTLLSLRRQIGDGKGKGCLQENGSSVRDWVRCQLSKELWLQSELTNGDMWHVVGILHFSAWDEESYGKKPTGDVGPPVDTMRSPTMRLIDAEPIDRTALYVSGNKRRRDRT